LIVNRSFGEPITGFDMTRLFVGLATAATFAFDQATDIAAFRSRLEHFERSFLLQRFADSNYVHLHFRIEVSTQNW